MGFRILRDPEAFSNAQAKAANGWTNRLFEARSGTIEIKCRGCDRSMYIPPSQVGQRAHCSLQCRATHPRPAVGDWASRIWEKREGTIERECKGCLRTMHLPRSKSNRGFCSLECRSAATEVRLTKCCEECGERFSAWNAEQRFCSQKCNAANGRISSPENLVAAQEGRRKAIAEGRIVFRSGIDNPQWKGGPEALRKRQIASGKSAEWLRRYRNRNPDKAREFTARRAHRKIGKLPYGTIPRIREAQRGRCAICRCSLRRKYHVDHIQPLARGGQHVAGNIQLLCAPCNLAKSSRDPILHMQSLGRLL